MGEDAATERAEKAEDEKLLDELPEGDDGWEYIEEAATRADSEHKDFSGEGGKGEENGETGDGRGEYVEEETTATDGAQDSDSSEEGEEEEDRETHETTLQELEQAVEESSGHEIERKVADADLELGKGDVTGFVRKTDVDVARASFAPGKDWNGTGNGFSELGWINDGELTATGASVLAYAGDVVDEAGDEAALVGYLNSVGVDIFLKEALRRGPDESDEGDEGDGFLGGLLG